MSTSAVEASHTKDTRESAAVKVAVAQGDGIGPEIMEATLRVLESAGANIEPEFVDLGEQAYLKGHTAGITDQAWEVIRRNRVIFKAPITTPQGKGYKRLNVTLRKSLGLFANVRPVSALHPFVRTPHPNMDVVIVRENEEDLYAGIEHRQTQDVYQCLKLITRPGSERIIRYAFEYARAFGRQKVTCMIKDNIMKVTDGLFHQVFEEISSGYPDIQSETQIVDIGSARLAARPESYDVIVCPNLYGDIISDIAAEIAGSVGLSGSANIGTDMAMFEAIHGSAPDIAGKGIANPSGLINAAVFMLSHLEQKATADLIRNAWLATIEQGYHTADIFQAGLSREKVSTRSFAGRVISNLGEVPSELPLSDYASHEGRVRIPAYQRNVQTKELVGVDIFLDWRGEEPDKLGEALAGLGVKGLKLKMITNRGVKVYPNGLPETYLTDHWRCRFVGLASDVDRSEPMYSPVTFDRVLQLLGRLSEEGYDLIKTENLYEFAGKRGFSLGQGE